MAAPRILSRGDVLKTNPLEGYWGCALVLSAQDETPESDPMCHIGITSTVFTHDYDFEELEIEKLEILQRDRQIRTGLDLACATVRETSIGMYSRAVDSSIDIIGNVDVSSVFTAPLEFKFGDGTGDGWPGCGVVEKSLGYEAVHEWRSVHDRAQWLQDMAEAERTHREMLAALAEEDREKRRSHGKGKKRRRGQAPGSEQETIDRAEFWRIIGLFDWAETGDDEAVIAPAVEALAKNSLDEIAAFEEHLSQCLYALDTMRHARCIGDYAYVDADTHFSVDWFLYARCCVVANGKEVYESVLNDPKEFPKDMEFEALLSVASSAYKAKTGEEFSGFETSVSYETFSNTIGWSG